MTTPTAAAATIVVVSNVLPDEITFQEDGSGGCIITDRETRLDALDDFNHPRVRRGYILKALKDHNDKEEEEETDNEVVVEFVRPSPVVEDDITSSYRDVHTEGLLDFFKTAWQKWSDLGEHGRDPMASLNNNNTKAETDDDEVPSTNIPALIPGNVPLPRDPHQRPSNNVMGQMGYYCTEICTPVFADLLEEIQQDSAILSKALSYFVDSQPPPPPPTPSVVYALNTHPGHHAARDSFGGYCYLNHAARAAYQLHHKQRRFGGGANKVAILDIDYHCGNGTASIFWDDPNILVVSIHCHPDYDYPFHSGYDDENKGGSLMHLPLLPGATWEQHYQPALQKGLDHIFDEFGAQALVVSLGLDTLKGDPVTLRRAGFELTPNDYKPMGRLIGSRIPIDAPCLIVQEGGYKMDQLGQAVADVIVGIAEARPTTRE